MTAIPVLLVEENPTFLRILSHVLREYCGDEVLVVGTSPGGENALDQAQRLKPWAMVVSVDQPNQANLQLIPRLRLLLPSVTLVAIGQFDEEASRQAAQAVGADAYIAKAALNAELLPVLCRAVGEPLDSRPMAKPGVVALLKALLPAAEPTALVF